MFPFWNSYHKLLIEWFSNPLNFNNLIPSAGKSNEETFTTIAELFNFSLASPFAIVCRIFLTFSLSKFDRESTADVEKIILKAPQKTRRIKNQFELKFTFITSGCWIPGCVQRPLRRIKFLRDVEEKKNETLSGISDEWRKLFRFRWNVKWNLKPSSSTPVDGNSPWQEEGRNPLADAFSMFIDNITGMSCH